MNLAPVVLFVYNRPELARQTLESLSRNILAKDSALIIYADGPKPNATPQQLERIKEVRALLQEKQWCKTVTIVASDENKGLAKSIINGVTDIIDKHGKIIVLEDDVVLSPYFLNFMNDALETYKNIDEVLSIGTWSYFCPSEKLSEETYFFRFPDCKGWGTFKRAWDLFEADASAVYKKLKQQKKLEQFNADLPLPYFTNMLKDQINGKINSWAIRWTATAILNNKLSLFPSKTLVKDVGFGADATHENANKDYNSDLIINLNPVPVKKTEVLESQIAVEAWRSFYLLHFIPPLTMERAVREAIKKITPKKLIKLYRSIRYGNQ